MVRANVTQPHGKRTQRLRRLEASERKMAKITVPRVAKFTCSPFVQNLHCWFQVFYYSSVFFLGCGEDRYLTQTPTLNARTTAKPEKYCFWGPACAFLAHPVSNLRPTRHRIGYGPAWAWPLLNFESRIGRTTNN